LPFFGAQAPKKNKQRIAVGRIAPNESNLAGLTSQAVKKAIN